MSHGNRSEDRALEASYLRPAYDPRRRRNDVAVTGVIGFVVGAIFGLGALGVVALISFLAESLVGLIGFVPVMLVTMLAGGIVLAISAVRSSR